MTPAARLPGLDLLRALAVVWVMLFHSFLVGGLGPDWEWLSRYGWMGVDVFFVLSGYLIGGQVFQQLAAQGRVDMAAFYWRRALRILPAFWVVLAVYTLVPAAREAPGMEPWWVFALFVFNLCVDYLAHPAFSHAWSLCVEEHFYLLFPALAWALSRRPSLRRTAAVALAIVLGGIALRSAIWLQGSALDPPRAWFVEDLYYPTWCRLDGLLAGVLLAALQTWRPAWWAGLRARANGVLLAGLALLALAMVLFSQRTGLLANSVGWPVLSLALALNVFAAAQPGSLIGRWRLPGVAWVAAASYSLYLSHKIAYHLAQPWIEAHLHGWAAFAAYALAVGALGAALHHTVERPALRWRDAHQRPTA
ncbi:MAG: acyltransferase [Proteobacteria bacterium]|nr:acyltransferase [Pseudomonadota bacterium]